MRAAARTLLLPGLAAALVGCGDDAGTPDAAPEWDFGAPIDQGNPRCADADGDGIVDVFEGSFDQDGDGFPNDRDVDSDSDGLSDSTEAGPNTDCESPPVDSDSDGTPDYLDTDSDGDGLLDSEELELGFDPTRIDTNGDGCPDPAELIEQLCGDSRNAVLMMGCGVPGPGSASYSWTGDAPLPSAALEVSFFGLDRPATEPQAVLPAGGATLTPTGFADVQPGATITFAFRFDGFRRSEERTMRSGQLTLVDGEGETLDTGRIYVFGTDICPRVRI